MKKLLILIVLFSAPTLSTIRCDGYKLTINDSEGLVRADGELVTSQKAKCLGKKGDESNAKWDMGIMPSRDGSNYGFQLIERDGKSWLNVQLLQNSMDTPKLIGSYPCKTI